VFVTFFYLPASFVEFTFCLLFDKEIWFTQMDVDYSEWPDKDLHFQIEVGSLDI